MNDEVPSNTDDLFLNLLSDNNPAALSILFGDHYEALYRNVTRIVKDSDDAKDVVLELIENVWEKRHTLRLTKPVRRYLLKAAHNRSVNLLRKRQKWFEFLEELFKYSARETMRAPDQDMEFEELEIVVKTALARLPDKSKEAFFLSRGLEMDYNEIASVMGVTAKAVERYISVALRSLRNTINEFRG